MMVTVELSLRISSLESVLLCSSPIKYPVHSLLFFDLPSPLLPMAGFSFFTSSPRRLILVIVVTVVRQAVCFSVFLPSQSGLGRTSFCPEHAA
jgi:hypothetical protein